MKYKLSSLSSIILLSGCTLNMQEQQKPNVIIFLVDDLGLMDTQVPFLTDGQGNPVRYPLNDWYRTPNVERLANQGIRFSTFYAHSVSSPTRTSIMTGQNATRHRITNWINPESNNKTPFGPKEWNWTGLKSNDVTLARILQQAGYRTIHAGKGHFGSMGSEGENPQNIGFDVNIAGSSFGQPGSYYGEWGYGHLRGDSLRAVPGLEKYHGSNVFLSDAITIEANAEIAKAVEKNKPFFLHLAHFAVHTPFEPDHRFLGNYNSPDKSDRAKIFAALVEGMDKSLGDVMDHLENMGVAENTLIIFLGDNGSDAPLGDEKGHFSSAPLRGKKATEYEGGTRTAFIVGWAKPNSRNKFQKSFPIKQNAIQKQLATVMDIYPTVLSVTGIQSPEYYTVDGFDLKAQLSGETNKTRTETFLMHFPHAHRGSYFTVFRHDDWKLIYWYRPETPENPTCELYNLAVDPFEKNDLSASNKDMLASMIRQMAEQLESEGALYPQDADGNVLKPINMS